MYYGGIYDSNNSFCLSSCLLALSIWQTRCVIYNMTNFGQINNVLVLILVLVLVLVSFYFHLTRLEFYLGM